MGMISSNNRAIENCWFKEIRNGELLDIVAAVKVTDQSAVVRLAKPVRGKDFAVLGKSHGLDKFCMTGEGLHHSPFFKGVLAGLIKLGAITQADVDEHIVGQERADSIQRRRRLLASLNGLCLELGIEPPIVEIDPPAGGAK
jgi:hypothetical protein